jgi:hypothetical protein
VVATKEQESKDEYKIKIINIIANKRIPKKENAKKEVQRHRACNIMEKVYPISNNNEISFTKSLTKICK